MAALKTIWRTEWGGKIYLSVSISNHSKGIAILFNPRLQVIVRKEIKSDNGQILILETDVDGERFVLVNIYSYLIYFYLAQQKFLRKTSRGCFVKHR